MARVKDPADWAHVRDRILETCANARTERVDEEFLLRVDVHRVDVVVPVDDGPFFRRDELRRHVRSARQEQQRWQNEWNESRHDHGRRG